ncbi:MAG TPA: glycerate kinase [Solirubrobacteraceae bacterium]
MSAPRLLVAPDSFKGTLSAPEVAAALVRGAASAGATTQALPIADGGEGTLDALAAALDASLRSADVEDPLGRPITARWALAGATAIVEMAEASGLGRVAEGERDAWAASTRGTGQLLLAAARSGAQEILVGVGGSATTDGGLGAVRAVEEGGGLGEARVVVLCDVSTPFERAAEVFAPQKGAGPDQVEALTQRLHEIAAGYFRDPRGNPMTGAAGGLSGGLWAALGARLEPGARFVLDRVGFDAALAGAAAVLTGEGRLDAQTLQGKAAGEVAVRGRRAGVPVHAVVGANALEEAEAERLGLASVRVAGTVDELEAAGAELAASL